eukprot:3958041-Prymnesium_polylepis.2
MGPDNTIATRPNNARSLVYNTTRTNGGTCYAPPIALRSRAQSPFVAARAPVTESTQGSTARSGATDAEELLSEHATRRGLAVAFLHNWQTPDR